MNTPKPIFLEGLQLLWTGACASLASNLAALAAGETSGPFLRLLDLDAAGLALVSTATFTGGLWFPSNRCVDPWWVRLGWHQWPFLAGEKFCVFFFYCDDFYGFLWCCGYIIVGFRTSKVMTEYTTLGSMSIRSPAACEASPWCQDAMARPTSTDGPGFWTAAFIPWCVRQPPQSWSCLQIFLEAGVPCNLETWTRKTGNQNGA